jgi:hypothetical protein
MNIPRTTRQVIVVWLLLLALVCGGVVALRANRVRLLRAIGASEGETRLAEPTSLLKIDSAYARLLVRFHEGNPSASPKPELASAPDFKRILRLAEGGNAAARRESPGNVGKPAIPVDFILADVCWMAGREAEAARFLESAFRQAGLASATKVKEPSRDWKGGEGGKVIR